MNEIKDNFPLVSKVRLKERDADGEFGPFIVNNNSHSCIKKIIDAFESSKEVKLGYATIQKDKGLVQPTMKRKTLYLAGESVRDHLKNKHFTTYDLVTDASPDEIKKILGGSDTGLEECKPHTTDLQIIQKYKKLPELEDNCFYASRWDNSGEEIEVTAKCKGMTIHISPFGMHSKNRMTNAKKVHFATNIEQDASTRDLTINALYIKLKDSDGENGELLDPRGGMHDLKAGVVRLIEKPSKAYDNNPYLPLILSNICSRFTEDGKIPENILKNFPESKNLDQHIVRRIFVAAIENHDVPLSKYFDNIKEANLDKSIFTNLKFANLCDNKICHVLPHNKLVVLAYILLDNDPHEVKNVLSSQGYNKNDIENIIFLIKMGRMIKNDIKNPHIISDLFSKPLSIPKSKVKEFLEVMGTPKAFRELIDQKFNYFK
jgi:hypothetical protein